MKKNLFYIAACTLLFISCRKAVDSSIPALTDSTDTVLTNYVKFSSEALEYVQIPLNKYFIYKDSTTGNTDSVVVTKSILEDKFMSAHRKIGGSDLERGAYYYQIFTLVLSKSDGNTVTDWFHGIANGSLTYSHDPFLKPLSTDAGNLSLMERDLASNTDKLCVFDFPFSQGTQAIIPSLTIEGNDYADVVQFTNNNNLSTSDPDYFAATYYWAKGIGIIQRSITTANSTQTWTLVRNG